MSPLDPSGATKPVPLSHRLRALQIELTALESELADPSNPLLHKEREEENVDAGELIRGLVDVRSRLDKIRKGKEGRARLVGAVLDDSLDSKVLDKEEQNQASYNPTSKTQPTTEMQSLVDLDQRVGELEHLIGSSSMTLDEVCCISVSFLPKF